MFNGPKYVYSLWDGKVERATVTKYDPETGRIEGFKGRGRFTTTLGVLYFETPEEAVRSEHEDVKEALVDARQEVQDALATYKTVRRIASMSFEEYYASIPKDFT